MLTSTADPSGFANFADETSAVFPMAISDEHDVMAGMDRLSPTALLQLAAEVEEGDEDNTLPQPSATEASSTAPKADNVAPDVPMTANGDGGGGGGGGAAATAATDAAVAAAKDTAAVVATDAAAAAAAATDAAVAATHAAAAVAAAAPVETKKEADAAMVVDAVPTTASVESAPSADNARDAVVTDS